MSDAIHVTMLGVLRPKLEEWLRADGFLLAHMPDSEPNVFIVVPGPERWAAARAEQDEELTG